jgi:hypothetical protein
MKKLLCCVGAVLALWFLVAVIAFRNPRSAIVGLSRGGNKHYEELFVVKRDRTFEQLLRRRSDGVVLLHSGTWRPTREDPAGQMFLRQSGGKTENYVTYDKKISLYPDTVSLGGTISSMEPMLFMQAPRSQDLDTWEKWRAAARPFQPAP